jgi:hypothetical protein
MIFAIVAFGSIAAAQAQDKIYGDLAGDYELELGDRTLPFTIFLKDGKLLFDARIPGKDGEPMAPVKGKDLTFTSLDPNGYETVFVFVLNAAKHVTGCTVSLPAQGLVAEARKIQKSA